MMQKRPKGARQPAEIEKRRVAARALKLARAAMPAGKRILVASTGRKKTAGQPAKTTPAGPRIRVFNVHAHPEMFVEEIVDRRAGGERRNARNRRVAFGDRRKQWISPVEPVVGKDGYYHVTYSDGTRERRKITNYAPKNGGFICFTDRRMGNERRGAVDRRGQKAYRVERVTNGAPIERIPGARDLIALERGLRKKGGQ